MVLSASFLSFATGFTYHAPSALNAELEAKCSCRKSAKRSRKNPEGDENSDEKDKDTDQFQLGMLYGATAGISYMIVKRRPMC